ncbi:Transcriptional regulator, predicted component of viral defense system [Eubacterium uniforme]|uniref:Transcriptional regulator, predicted component of viral defense system n=1 Tax=Eubacterium uniforme TaxID=39495 RepID=A0A1T4VL78_9FIRM|nr:type IV toxin-antitoxin system AbiEi family antitoxin domain-containing protein [Eubacterium uniforme]SKA65655.1 Transcriptional regulator, predicted component of viral defense system [Eubacterium uniforme]
MNKFDVMNELIKKNNGYLYTSDVEKENISRTYLAQFVKKYNLERVAQGIYITSDTWQDDLFILQKCYPKAVFSGETALSLHVLIDREYNNIRVSVPKGFSGSRLREKGVVVHQEKEENYDLGITEVKTIFGNTVNCYDKERCICDLVKSRGKIDVQNYQTAILEYMRSKDKDLSRLVKYAEKLGVYDEIMMYVEVLV